MILDGWGIDTDPKVSAIEKASTEFVDSLYTKFPHSKLTASGLAVGLPEGQMGNSEVGHMNIGAGRVVYQDLVKVNLALEDGELAKNATFLEALDFAKANHKRVHLIGLVSDGGVHSHINHLTGICSIAHNRGVKDLFIHAFTDGRDTDPKFGLKYLRTVQEHLDKTGGEIASVTGRYYAMDRDKRWERVKLAYDAMVSGSGKRTDDVFSAIQQSYDENVTDEFIKPIIHTDPDGEPIGAIRKGDVVICFNFRTDRGRQITTALTQEDFPEQGMHKLDLHYVTLTNHRG